MSSNSHVKRYFLKAKATWVPEYIDARSVQFAGSHVVFRDGTNTRAIRADLLLDIRVNEAAPDDSEPDPCTCPPFGLKTLKRHFDPECPFEGESINE